MKFGIKYYSVEFILDIAIDQSFYVKRTYCGKTKPDS